VHRLEAMVRDKNREGLGFKQVALLAVLCFAIVLAVLVVRQMSSEAMAVVIGVVCGVAAGIPTAALLLVALSWRDKRRLEELEEQARRAQRSYPPVVVIQGGTPQALPSGPQGGYWLSPLSGPPTRRQFHVVGGNDLLSDGSDY
jgi:hypothetical protein